MSHVAYFNLPLLFFFGLAVLIDAEYEPLVPREDKSDLVSRAEQSKPCHIILNFLMSCSYWKISINNFSSIFQEILRFNLSWKNILLLIAVWASFLLIQIVKASISALSSNCL